MLLIGLLFLLFRQYIPIEKISEHSEQLVGAVLIVVGLWALYSIFGKRKNHKHPHVHNAEEPYIHIHEHEHDKNMLNHGHAHSKRLSKINGLLLGLGFYMDSQE